MQIGMAEQNVQPQDSLRMTGQRGEVLPGEGRQPGGRQGIEAWFVGIHPLVPWSVAGSKTSRGIYPTTSVGSLHMGSIWGLQERPSPACKIEQWWLEKEII